MKLKYVVLLLVFFVICCKSKKECVQENTQIFLKAIHYKDSDLFRQAINSEKVENSFKDSLGSVVDRATIEKILYFKFSNVKILRTKLDSLKKINIDYVEDTLQIDNNIIKLRIRFKSPFRDASDSIMIARYQNDCKIISIWVSKFKSNKPPSP